MISKKLPDIGSPFVPQLVHDFMSSAHTFSDFTTYGSDLTSLQKYATARQFSQEKRITLVHALQAQYDRIGGHNSLVLNNIQSLLDHNTFTITTGQQLQTFLGPLFFVTKILDCIATAQKATQESLDKKFVPIFWMASEDHDFAEINTVSVYNTSFTWEKEQTGGPVGRFSPQGLTDIVAQLRERLDKTDINTQYLDIFAYAYSHFPTLAQATHYILDTLFGDKGLIIIDPDDIALKRLFIPILSADIFQQKSYPAIMQQTNALLDIGGKKQAQAREINVFYMTDTHRGRIIQEGDIYVVDGSDIQFNHDTLLKHIEESPESFSPNVFLRPLYQETILPNVLYISGPAEFNYWLQMKELFAVHGLTMPVVIPRTFCQFIGTKNYEKIQTGPVSLESYFGSYETFLDEIKHIDTEVLVDTQKVINTLAQSLTDLQETFVKKHITHKKITKSLTAISHELSTLSTSVDLASNAVLEESDVYAPYIKIKKNLFDVEHRFERNSFVVGQLALFDQMLHQENIPSDLGRVVLYIYD